MTSNAERPELRRLQTQGNQEARKRRAASRAAIDPAAIRLSIARHTAISSRTMEWVILVDAPGDGGYVYITSAGSETSEEALAISRDYYLAGGALDRG